MKNKLFRYLYFKLNNWAYRYGSKELKCPSCKEDITIQDLQNCECGFLGCCECITMTEDAHICSQCIESFKVYERVKSIE